jgi:uncharacterized protein (UPF0335 family)
LTASLVRVIGRPADFCLPGRPSQNRNDPMDDINPSTAGQLKAFIERIERLEEEKRTISEDIKEVYAEAKGNGFDAKILRKIVSLRKQDANERREQEEILETYLRALGMEM